MVSTRRYLRRLKALREQSIKAGHTTKSGRLKKKLTAWEKICAVVASFRHPVLATTVVVEGDRADAFLEHMAVGRELKEWNPLDEAGQRAKSRLQSSHRIAGELLNKPRMRDAHDKADGITDGDVKLAKTYVAHVREQLRKQRPLVVGGRTLSPQILGDDHKQMSSADRSAVEQQLAEHIQHGELIFKGIQGGGFVPEATDENVSALCFYLRVKAEEANGKPFFRGAFTAPDPDGKVASWMESSKGIYVRKTSHLSSADKEAEFGMGRGIDFSRDGPLEGRLPYGMRTLLFQRFTREGENRLYFKMETEGALVNPEMLRKDQGVVRSRQVKLADVGESIAHGKNFFIKEQDNSGLARQGEKFEDLPKDLQKAYGDIAKAAKKDGDSAPLVSGGVEVAQIEQKIARLKAWAKQHHKEAEMGPLIAKWEKAAVAHFGPGYQATSGKRVGNEVILTSQHLSP